MKIGIDLGGTNVRVALVDENGVIESIKEPCKADKSEIEILNHIKGMIRKILIPEVKGIGIGVPSSVDTQKGIVYNVMNIPSWKEVHLKEILEKEFGLPVYVNNDANCFVLGEKYYGNGKPYNNIIGVTIGTGLGSGVIINGELYIGNNTCAGEIGCPPYLDDIYERYCSSQYFVKHHNTTGAKAYELAQKGNPEALDIWNKFGEHIANLVSLIIFTYDPEAIIFGGSIANAYELFAPAMHEKLRTFMFPKAVEKLFIGVSSVPDIAILGAASLVKNV
ncbi:ROK family protein [Dysgonomonas sp. OttesenSCG-928-M03]|nr:ROK family protein [Dysgonomonas sp. OttesenSCG-928-M03]